MSGAEIKAWAKEKVKGKTWELLVPIIVASVLSHLTIGQQIELTENGRFSVNGGMPLGIFLYFVEVGLIYFMVKFINDKEHEFKDLFYFTKDYVRIFLVNLLQTVFVFLWSLLFFVPGIIKSFAYSLVPFLLADERYNNLGYRDLLNKSEEMMNGHKMDYFVFNLSFIGWFLLIPLTLGIISIWFLPYYMTAKTRFLNDIKVGYEGNLPPVEQTQSSQVSEAPAEQQKTAQRFCTNCGTELVEGNEFCQNCGQRNN